MSSYACGNRCGVDMEYIGGGNWKCPKCGRIIPFGEPEEGPADSGESYCNVCEHNSEYPECLIKCPYDD